MTDFQAGQTVTFAQEETGRAADGYGSRHLFRQGDTAEVTRVNKNRIVVKTQALRYGNTGVWSYTVAREALETPNGEAYPETPKAPRPKSRKLGEVPEGMIDPKDPRLKWFWEDAAKYANRQGYCAMYDQIVTALGAPARPRDITVTITHNGVQLTATIEATSEKEAKELLKAKLAPVT